MPSQEDLELLLTVPSESLSVEYKSWLILTENPGKAILAKAAIAIANEGGGIVVLGMREDTGDGGRLGSQARPATLRRYSQDEINAAIGRFAEPAFHCGLEFAQHPDTGNEHAFVDVPGGMIVPVDEVGAVAMELLVRSAATYASRAHAVKSLSPLKNGAAFLSAVCRLDMKVCLMPFG